MSRTGPVAFTIATFCAAHHISRTHLYELAIRRAKHLQERAIDSVRIDYEKGLISAEEAEQITAQPLESQRMYLSETLLLKRLKRKPSSADGCVHISGRYIPPTSARDKRLAKELIENGIPELRALVMSGRNIGLVTAAAVSRRTPDEQRAILASAAWVTALRRLPLSRFGRRQLDRNPSYFERG